MKNMYDIRQLLKKYGIFVYTGHPIGDIEQMMTEIKDLYAYHMIDKQHYLQAIMLLQKEKNKNV